jgi:hypothetical protein
LSSSWQAPPGKRLEKEFSLFSTLGCSQRGVQRIEDASFVSRRASKQMLTWNAKRCIYNVILIFFSPLLCIYFAFPLVSVALFVHFSLSLALSPSLPLFPAALASMLHHLSVASLPFLLLTLLCTGTTYLNHYMQLHPSININISMVRNECVIFDMLTALVAD